MTDILPGFRDKNMYKEEMEVSLQIFESLKDSKICKYSHQIITKAWKVFQRKEWPVILGERCSFQNEVGK